MNIIQIKALKTNYIWMIYNNNNECIIIDPGESTVIFKVLKTLQFSLKAILLTHNHYDHVAGVKKLIQCFPNIEIYGSKETENEGTNQIVKEGDNFVLLNNIKITILHLPGHTEQHIGFYFNSKLFCGDTVFSAGCGKVQTGLIKSMYHSFLKIKNLPKDTLIYSGHEYTLSNINFVRSILPKNQTIINYQKKIIKLRKYGKSTIPTELNLELKINPFFRCADFEIQKSLNLFPEKKNEWKIFSQLRKQKDIFNKETEPKH